MGADPKERLPIRRRDALSVEEIIKLAGDPLTDVEHASRAFGMGVNLAYDLIARGEFPVRVLRLGRLIKIPTADILDVLGIRRDHHVTSGPAGVPGQGLGSVHPITNQRDSA